MITTKNLSRAAFVLLAGTLAPAALEAADTITIPAPTTADWYAQRSNANVSAPTVGDDGTVTFSKMDYGAYAWAYFTPVKLEVGQWISFSGTAIFNSMYAGTESKDPGKFLFGLFDSNTNSQASLNSALGISGTSDADASKHGINADGKSATLGMKVLTGDMTGFFCDSSSSSAYAWLATHSNYGFLATNGSKTTHTSQTLSPTLAVPAALTEYDFSFKVSKTKSDAYEIAVSSQSGTGDEISATATFSGVDSVSQFDVIGVKSPVASGTTGETPSGTFTFANLFVTTTGTVIPEPSALGLITGAFALALAGTRRRARHR